MSFGEEVCAYLGRPVRLVHVSVLADAVWSESVVLLSASEFACQAEFWKAIELALNEEALAVLVCGDGAGAAFAFMLGFQSRLKRRKHTMTYFSEAPLDDSVQEFFHSSWPAEERFDDWKSYLVPYSGDGAVVMALEALLG